LFSEAFWLTQPGADGANDLRQPLYWPFGRNPASHVHYNTNRYSCKILHKANLTGNKTMITPSDLNDYAERFKLLGHPVRLQILDVLRRSPECVCHMEALLGKPQPYISQQLRVLREAGVLADSKDGLNVYYHLIDAQVAALLNAALGPVLPGERGPHQAAPGCVCPKCAGQTHSEIRLVESQAARATAHASFQGTGG
jgi:ArsR family transcriptional regulator